MSETLHRKDISSADFTLLARFCRALQILQTDHVSELALFLGQIRLFLPVWYNPAGFWRLSRYKEFNKEAIGIDTADFRRICRYLMVKENVLVNTLYRLSMLAVLPYQSVLDPPKFRQQFYGVMEIMPSSHFGFVIERRRAMGGFK
jgi:hypothetical protein